MKTKITESTFEKFGFEKMPLDPYNLEEGYYHALRFYDKGKSMECDLELVSVDKNGILEVYLFPYEDIRFQHEEEIALLIGLFSKMERSEND